MSYMFSVRAPPSRVLLLLRRHVVVVAHPLAPRSLLTPHGRPSLAALQFASVFNQGISNWDVSSVTSMRYMFFVRASPSRVLLLLLRRCVVVVAHPLAPRSLLTPHGRPSLAVL